ncbi:MAG: chitobiase/beta-hexosaminidase C-terminal domain-containing protein [Bacteroidales bacterium]|nr:chitobiase/beta-hexosaminidase C-terminal domain-containing protein [Bacteroidales bacterium]
MLQKNCRMGKMVIVLMALLLCGSTQAQVVVHGSVFGAGKGLYSPSDNSGLDVARVHGNSTVVMSVGTVDNSVYGGGELGAVNGNTDVAISGTAHVGGNDLTSYKGFVFGGGSGTIQDPGYANVKGNTHVTISGGYVHNTVFGGGELASVGTFTLAASADATNDIVVGEPFSCADGTGRSLVEISGGQIGHKDATLRVDIGYVFGAGMGVYTDPHAVNEPAPSPDNARFGYVNTAEVRVSGSAFIVGAVWGGSENGQVLDSCGVIVSGGQIGNGYDWTNEEGKGLYTAANWDEAVAAVKAQDASRINAIAGQMPECYHWKYGRDTTINGTPTKHYLPYDRYAYETGDTTASYNPGDGHTFFGNVFGGGSGYYPYATDNRGTGGEFTTEFFKFQGRVRGNTYVEISGGHILTSVYGGCEYADVLGDCRVVMTGGTLGLPRTIDSITDHPVTSYLFGAGKGDQRTEFNMRTNVQNVKVKVSGGLIFGSVFGGGEDGHVLGNAKVTIDSAAWVGTWGTSYVDGNIFGGGRGFGGTAYTAGSIGGNVEVNINNDTVAGTPVRPTMLGSVYGGGRLASVGSCFVTVGDPHYSQLQDGDDHGNITINITGGTIGNLREFSHPVFDPAASYSVGDVVAYQNQMYRFTSAHSGAWNEAHVTDIVHTTGGNVFGSSMGRLFKLGATDETDPNSFLRIWPGMAKCKNTEINISGDATIYSNVYGGGELGYVMKDTKVTIDGSAVTIGHGVATGTTDACYLGSVYGGGYGSENIIPHINDTASITSTSGFVSAAMHAGRVYGNTEVELKNGHILGNIYGGGELASVGRRWMHMTYAYDPADPYKFQHPYDGTAATYNYEVNGVTYTSYGYSTNVGNTKVTVSGGKVGEVDNVTVGTYRVAGHSTGRKGSVFGGGKGRPGYYDTINDIDYGFHYTRMAYVDQTQVIISGGQIAASVFGGGENGHVRYNATVTMDGGTVGLELTAGEKELDANGEARVDIYHGNIYGGGRGIDMTQGGYLGEASGQVFGNTNVDISGGTVRHHVFGGGSIASVGTYVDYPIVPGDHAEVLTGKATVTIHGGVIGSDGMNNGFVYGSGRGVAYSGSDFAHKAFVNNTEVNIQDGADVRGSVFGGGANGHVMTDTKVNISGGTIGSPINSTDWTLPVAYTPTTQGAADMVGTEWVKYPTNDPSDPNYNDYVSQLGESAVIHYHGNVYGGGRGVDRHDGNFSTSAGRVYGNTNVDISGGIVYHNVYGGGSMASVGYYNEVPITPHSTILSGGIATVTIRGGQIGTTGHNNGHVFGSSRGMAGSEYSHFAFTEDTYVNIQTGADIRGSVFGSGENGHVLNNTYVTMTGGKVGRDLTVKATLLGDGTTELVTGEACTEEAGADMAVIFRGNIYGGGRGVDRHNGKLSLSAGTVYGNTHVDISGGTVTHNVYGGGSMASVGSTLYKDAEGNYTSYEPVSKGTTPVTYYDTVGIPERSHRYKDSYSEYTSRIPVETPCTYKYKTSADATDYTSDTRVPNPATGDYYDSIKYRWMNPTTGDYTETDTTYYDEVGADTITGMAIVTIRNGATIGNAGEFVVDRKGFNNGRVFGAGRGMAGGAYAARANVYNTVVTINGGTVNGSVFGGGENGHVLQDTRVTVNGGTIGHNMNASYAAVEAMFGSSQPAMVPIMKSRMANVGNVYGAGRGCDLAHDGSYSMSAGYVRGNTIVNINGGTIHRNVYGGGSMALVGDYGLNGNEDDIQDVNSGLATVNIHSSVGDANDNVAFGGSVFGSSRGRANDPANPDFDFAEMAYAFKTQVNIGNDAGDETLTVYRNVYGGGEAGHVDYGGTQVNILSGTVQGSVFGGGMGASTSPTAGIVDGNTQVNIGTDAQASNNVVIGEYVFGGNDAGSSPLGTMQVDIWRTAHSGANECPAVASLTDEQKANYLTESVASPAANYAIKAVYGGGNRASTLTGDKATDGGGNASNVLNDKYITQRLNEPSWPVELTRLSKVVVHECSENTVQYVYGGGKAANTYKNDVTIEGGRVFRAFAGGDGSEEGTYSNVVTDASVRVQGGIVYEVFGGSNTRGVIGGTTSIDLTPVSPCELVNSETFGGGNEAAGNGGTIELLCGSTFHNFYGGARNANINGDIVLNVRGGVYDTIFGGNKDGGVIDGNVTVNFYGGTTKYLFGGSNAGGNITGTITVVVDADPAYSCADGLQVDYVFGGGKNASYTPNDPSISSPMVKILNVPPAPHRGIYRVFGGGLGETATVTANPYVILGDAPSVDTKDMYIAQRTEGGKQVEGEVYGGGYAAPVVGNAYVTMRQGVVKGNLFGGGLGTSATISQNTVVAVFGTSEVYGNVYGGGNQGEVKGSTDIQIGYEETMLALPPTLYFDGVDRKVHISSNISGATIRYTVGDGSQAAPTPSTGTVYTDPVEPVAGQVIKAIATAPYYEPSRAAVATVPLADPAISIDPSTNMATLSYPGAGGLTPAIHYTTNGETPTYVATEYTAPFEVQQGDVVRAICILDGYTKSFISSLTVAKPEVTITGGNATFSCATPAAKLYYTVGDSPADPTTESTLYTGSPVAVAAGQTVKVIAVRPGYNNSDVASKTRE